MGRFLLEESLPRIPKKTKIYKVKHLLQNKRYSVGHPKRTVAIFFMFCFIDFFFVLDGGKGICLKNFVVCIFIFTLGLNFNVVHKVRTEIYSVSLKSIEPLTPILN